MPEWIEPKRRRWLLWGLLASTFLLVNIYRLSTAVLADDLMAAFRISGAQLGTLHAMFFAIYAVMQIPTGILVDRIGPRRTAASGAAVMNVGAIWFAIAGDYTAALGGRFLIGLGGSVIFVSMLRFCASWYAPNEFATLNGLSFAVGGIGGILATTPFAIAVDWLGWNETVLALGVFGLALAGATAAAVRDSPPQEAANRIGVRGTDRKLSTRETRDHLVRALGDRYIWAAGILMFCYGGVYLTLFGLWGIPYVVQMYDTSVQFASLFTLLGGAGTVVGPPLVGWMASRTGRRTSVILAGGVCYTAALAVIALFGRPPLVVVALVFFLLGMLLGTFVLTYPLIKDRHSDRASGIALGTINGTSFVGAAIVPTLMGSVLDSFWTGELVGGVRVYTATGYRLAFGMAAASGIVIIGCGIWLHWVAERSSTNGSGSAD